MFFVSAILKHRDIDLIALPWISIKREKKSRRNTVWCRARKPLILTEFNTSTTQTLNPRCPSLWLLLSHTPNNPEKPDCCFQVSNKDQMFSGKCIHRAYVRSILSKTRGKIEISPPQKNATDCTIPALSSSLKCKVHYG